MENQTPDQTQHPDPNEAETAARTSGLRRLFRRRPVMTGSAIGAIGMALALAVAGVMSAGAQSSDDDPPAATQTTASNDDDSAAGGGSTDDDSDSDDGSDDADDRSNSLRDFLRRFRAPSAEDRAAFESFKTCLTEAGVEGFEHDEDGTEISVTGPDGLSIVRLGDGSVTVTRSGDEVTITTTGDATVMDIEDLRTAWQTEAAAWQSAYESCRDRLPEGFRGLAARLGEHDFEDFDKTEILEELGIDTEDLADIGEEFAEKFAGIGERYAEEFAGIGEHFAEEFFANNKSWW